MEFKFETTNIYDTVGKIIQASLQCRKAMHPKGTTSHITLRLYNDKKHFICEYSGAIKNWVKSLKRDMHIIQKGSVESICYQHPSRPKW
jgi:hypothetical protein